MVNYSISSVVKGIDRSELKRDTGISEDDLRFILHEMGTALHDLIARSSAELMIDRRSITLRGGR